MKDISAFEVGKLIHCVCESENRVVEGKFMYSMEIGSEQKVFILEEGYTVPFNYKLEDAFKTKEEAENKLKDYFDKHKTRLKEDSLWIRMLYENYANGGFNKPKIHADAMKAVIKEMTNIDI